MSAPETPIIRGKMFAPYSDLVLGVSTRCGGVSPEPYGLNLSFNVGDERQNVIENRRRLFESLGIPPEELAIPEQCHSATVRGALHAGAYEKCDALVTSERRVFLVVTVADCIPLFIYDRNTKVVAAVHVGWRGAAIGIVSEAVKFMQSEFFTRPEHLIVFLGPAARACCYEVGKEVADKFPGEFLRPKSDGKFFLDLPSFSRAELMDAGVTSDRIEDEGRCTICNPQLFHSYRRGGPRSGRMMGVIGLNR